MHTSLPGARPMRCRPARSGCHSRHAGPATTVTPTGSLDVILIHWDSLMGPIEGPFTGELRGASFLSGGTDETRAFLEQGPAVFALSSPLPSVFVAREPALLGEPRETMARLLASDDASAALRVVEDPLGRLEAAERALPDGRAVGALSLSWPRADRAVIEAQVRVGTAIIKGTVTGHIQATERIDVYPPANITGDIQTPQVSIETGVKFNGNCSMVKPEPLSADSPKSDEKAK